MERRLSAIFAADMVGYSRLMEADEIGTLERQKAHRRELIDPSLEEFQGRIIKEMGDGLLVEFPSVVQALQCAVAIQQAMPDREENVSDERRISYRVGINLGDVIVDGDDIFGDGVNIAARLETMAEPGEICVSRGVFENARGKVNVSFHDLGERNLKNITHPVHVYRVSPSGQIAAADYRGTRNIDKPSLAVLPIENISGSRELDTLAAGLSEDLIAALAENSEISVASRHASAAIADKGLEAQEIARQLGAGNILEGRVQGSEIRVRVTLQLVDGASGNFVWAERFDGCPEDLFEWQDSIVHKALISIRTKLVSGDQARISASGTKNLTAWLKCNEAFEEWAKFSSESNIRAKEMFQQAMSADPSWSHPAAGFAAACNEAAVRGWTASREHELEQAVTYAQKAIELDPTNPSGYTYLAAARVSQGKILAAIELSEKAIEIAPNHFVSHSQFGWILARIGEYERSLAAFATSRRLRPTPSGANLANEAFVAHLAGRKEQALDLLQRSFASTDIIDAHVRLAALYSDMGRPEEAVAKVAEIMSRQPDVLVEEFTENLPFPDQERLDWYRLLLRDAGMPGR